MTQTQPEKRRNVPVVGLLGGIASGKSTVARLLTERGAEVVDADLIARTVLEDPEVVRRIEERFGAEVLESPGRVDRKALAEEVFGDAEAVADLNRITHPPILREVGRQLAELKARADLPIIVLDAPLLLEAGLHEEVCDVLVFVEVPENVRRRRATEGRALTEEQFSRRERSQLPLELKRQAADYRIANGTTVKDLEAQIDDLWPRLRRDPGKHST